MTSATNTVASPRPWHMLRYMAACVQDWTNIYISFHSTSRLPHREDGLNGT
jgi:hypothetical protein